MRPMASRPVAPLKWGVFKVARKSGAFANSIAFAVSQGMSKSAVILTPSAPLQAQTAYTLTIPEPRDYFGQPMPNAPLVINFTTGN